MSCVNVFYVLMCQACVVLSRTRVRHLHVSNTVKIRRNEVSVLSSKEVVLGQVAEEMWPKGFYKEGKI